MYLQYDIKCAFKKLMLYTNLKKFDDKKRLICSVTGLKIKRIDTALLLNGSTPI